MTGPARIFDLSQPVFPNCPQYPDHSPRPVQVRLFYMLAVQGVNKEIVELSTHTGTHCDAPYHFFEDGKTIDDVPLETYVGPSVIFDVRGKAPGSAIEAEDLAPSLDRLRPGSIALLNTGRGAVRANTANFLTDYVYLGASGAQALVDRGIKGVGIDAVSLGGFDDPKKAGLPHRIVLGSGAFITEELFFPDAVMDGRERLFVATPIKLRGCSGAWARAMLWE
jgi:arylformamidase